jgi:predicted SAM-dependent methyltransferase
LGAKILASTVKRLLPTTVKRPVRNLIKFVKYRWRRFKIRRPVARGEKIKIIVGAAETYQQGWYSTNQQWLDITKRSDWDNVFLGKRLITHVVAEHVFEHLTYDECRQALANMSAYMVDGARIRIAVPDGYHPDPIYQAYVGIGGIGDGAADHKQLLDVDGLNSLLRESGFEPKMIEGYDSTRRLVLEPYSPNDGFICRSRANPSGGNAIRNYIDRYTSLIVDGVKNC